MIEGRRRFFRAAAIGFATGGVAVVAMLAGPYHDFFQREPLGGFYDVQARSLLHLRWNVPPGSIPFEAFVVHGKRYIYFGPWPAILRIPIVVFTHALDGRLTQLSMALAFVVLAIFSARLAWITRPMVRSDAPVTRGEAIAVGVFAFVVSTGSVLFLASRPIIYHEAILWGAAFSVAAFFYIVRFVLEERRRSLIFASGFATLAVMSRFAVGLGPCVALVLIGAARGAAAAAQRWPPAAVLDRVGRRVLGWPGAGDEQPAVRFPALAVAAVVPLALYAYVNHAKFGTLFSLPLEKQELVKFSAARRAALAANGGSLFGLKFAPTTVLQYLRPDSFRFDRLFPWAAFPGPADVIGGVRFATLDFATSVPTAMPAIALAALVGAWTTARPPTDPLEARGAARLRIPLIGAAAGCVGSLAFGFVAQRYMGDFLPLLLLAATLGFHAAASAVTRGNHARRAAIVTLAGLAAAWTCFAGASLALQYQRAYGIDVPDAVRADYLALQLDVHDATTGGIPSNTRQARALPKRVGSDGQLLVVGDCAGLYWSDGHEWHPLEETPATGLYRLRVRAAPAAKGTLEPLLTAGTAEDAAFVIVRHEGGDRVVLEYVVGPTRYPSSPFTLRADVTSDVDVLLDRTHRHVHIDVAGRSVLDVARFLHVVAAPVRIGRDDLGGPGAPRFTGTVTARRAPTPLCDRLVSRHRPRHR